MVIWEGSATAAASTNASGSAEVAPSMELGVMKRLLQCAAALGAQQALAMHQPTPTGNLFQ
jgi:hypothetical protein